MTTINKETKTMTMTREFNAPRALVWKAFTDRDLVTKWWGPEYLSRVLEMDVRPGGVWFYCMTGTEGEWKDVDSCGKAHYLEVSEPELLSYRDTFVDKEGNEIPGMPDMVVTYRFEEKDGKTFMTSETQFSSLEDLQKVVEMGAEAGMLETLERLDELLATLKKD